MADAIMPAEGFDTLLDDETIMKTSAVFGGFFAAGAAQTATEGSLPWDVPNELYGVALAYGFYSVDMEYTDEMAMGAGANAFDALLQRFGLQESVQASLGGGA